MRITNDLAAIAALAGFTLVSTNISAQNDEREAAVLPTRYEVELIVFRHLDQSRNTPEIPAAASMIQDSPFELELSELPVEQGVLVAGDTVPGRQTWTTAAADDVDVQALPGQSRHDVKFLLMSPRPEWPDFVPFDEESFTLNGVYNRIIRLDAYEPVIHLGWVQPAKGTEEARPYRILSGPEAPVEISGTVTLYKERYLHLALDLALVSTTPDDVSNPATEIPPQRIFGLNMPASEDGPTGKISATHKLQQSRRVRVSNTHYFDHPLFGVIATISQIKETASSPNNPQTDAG